MAFAEENKKLIEQAVMNELCKISKEHGNLYHTPHEGYAVLKEEVEEAKEELNTIKHHLKQIFDGVRYNNVASRDTFVRWLEDNAIDLALEAVQIAAVCEKFHRGTVNK